MPTTDDPNLPRPKVFVGGPLAPEAVALLARGPLEPIVAAEGIASPLFDQHRAEIEGFVPFLTKRVDRDFLALCPRLRIVSNVAVGVDNIDLAACRERGVVVTNTPDVLTDATADLAFALLLGAARRTGEAERHLRARGFPPWSPTFMLGKRVTGATLGIVGMGRIGAAVARRASGFGMRVLYTSRHERPEACPGATRVALDELLGTSDFVSVHVALTSETRHLLDAEKLARMKRGAVLVNTSRGAVVDEAALGDALREGRLFAAGLDVYEREPTVHPGLLELENVLLLPHIGSAEPETRLAMATLAARNMVAFFETGRALTPV